MRIAFFGSSAFSVPALRSISASVSCVVTKLSKPKGRGYALEDNEVKRAALDLGLPLIEITSFKDEGVGELHAIQPDLFVVASFGLIIPRWLLDVPSVGAINVHPSLLPKYRGPSPMQWALLNGDTETGITLIRMSERMDAGNILYRERVPIGPEEDAAALSDRLSHRVGEIVPPFIQSVESDGLPEGEIQSEEEATYTSIISKEMGKIDWTKGAVQIVNQIRAFVLWPAAYTFLDGLMLKVFQGKVASGAGEGTPGTIESVLKEGIRVSTGEGCLLLEEVHLENRKRMSAFNFAQGFRGLTGKALG
jgi:methionyl-tRNA formyltransferase